MEKRAIILLSLGLSLMTSAQDLAWAKGGLYWGAADMKVDNTGSIYMATSFSYSLDLDLGPGTTSFSSLGGTDVAICKYDPHGELIWARRIGGTNDDQAVSLALDGAGHIFLAGHFSGTADL